MTATLDEDGTFIVEGLPPEIAELTARRYEAECQESYGGPAHGVFGHGYLNELAARVGGTVAFEPKRKIPPGTVY